MKHLQRILVIVKTTGESSMAINRAVVLAEKTGANLHLLSCIYDPSIDFSALIPSQQKQVFIDAKINRQQSVLDKLIEPLTRKGLNVTREVIWHRKLNKVVTAVCDDYNPDLVVNRISQSNRSINPFSMPIDWHLLRECPAPLLLVNQPDWGDRMPILAAVDAFTESATQQKLNQKIIDYTLGLANLFGSKAHVGSSFVSPAFDNSLSIPNFNHKKLLDEITQSGMNRLVELVASESTAQDCLHLVEGLPEEHIPDLAHSLGCQLLVMGTTGRRGLKGALMGNTAERVLTHLNCEILALKP